MGDANSPTTQRDHRAVFQCPPMVLDDLGDEGDTVLRKHIRQAHEACVRDFTEIDQLAKVSVDGNQNPVLGLRELQQGRVPRILAEHASFENIVPLAS